MALKKKKNRLLHLRVILLLGGVLLLGSLVLSINKFAIKKVLAVAGTLNVTGGATYSTINSTTVNATTGFQMGGQAPTGNILKGDGANFVSSPGLALTKTDDTNVTLTLGGTPGTALIQAASLTLGWTGQLAVARGGTGVGTFTKGIVVSPGTTTALTTIAGTDNYIPKWSSSYPTVNSSIYDNGNVGIGTTAPTQKLDVAGNININTNGISVLFSTFKGANSDGDSIFIGGGGQSSVGQVGNTTYGSKNTAIGLNSFLANTTGSYNTANGANSLTTNTTGANNSAIGNLSLYHNTTGFENTAIGSGSLFANTTGIDNTAIGYSSLYDLNISNGTGNNTAIGANSGRGIVTGINNTILGANVTGLSSTLSNNIIIADGAGNRRINVDSSGNVGIGTTAPATGLQVIGETTLGNGANGSRNLVLTPVSGTTSITTLQRLTGNGAGGMTVAADWNASTAPYHLYYFDGAAVTYLDLWKTTSAGVYGDIGYTGGNVGIGTTAPARKLQVEGNISLGVSSAANGTDMTRGIGIHWGGDSTTNLGGMDVVQTVGSTALNFVTNNYMVNSGTRMTIAKNGNVGIGTTAPGAALEINGNLKFTTANPSITATSYFTAPGGAYFNSLPIYTEGSIVARGGLSNDGASTGGNVAVNDGLYVSGNVGIGTTNPTLGKLQLEDATNASIHLRRNDSAIPNGSIYGYGTSGGSVTYGSIMSLYNGGVGFYTDSSPTDTNNNLTQTVVIDKTGNVGIGTTTPYQKLQVVGTTNTDSTMETVYSGAAGSGSGIVRASSSQVPTAGGQRVGAFAGGYFRTATNTSAGTGVININSEAAWTDGSSYPTYMGFNTTPSGSTSNAERMRIDSTGNVGIGTTAPAAGLDIAVATNSYFQKWTRAGAVLGTVYKNTGTPLTFESAANGSTLAGFDFEGGNVGIGTTAPTAKLDVNGTIKANGAAVVNNNVNIYNSSSALTLTQTYTDIPGMTVTFTPTYDEYALITVNGYWSNSGYGGWVGFQIVVNGTAVYVYQSPTIPNPSSPLTVNMMFKQSCTSGTAYTIKVQSRMYSMGGSATGGMQVWRMPQ